MAERGGRQSDTMPAARSAGLGGVKEPIAGQDFPDQGELRALARHPVTRELSAKLLQSLARHVERKEEDADARRP